VIQMLRIDRRGVEGMPLKLLIVALLVSLSFPCVWQALTYYDATVTVEEATRQASEIKAMAASAYLGGEGNIRTVHVHLRPSITGASPIIEVGGAPGSATCRTIRIISDHGVACTIPLDDPYLEIFTDTGEQVRLEQGETELVLRATRTADSLAIYAEVRGG